VRPAPALGLGIRLAALGGRDPRPDHSRGLGATNGDLATPGPSPRCLLQRTRYPRRHPAVGALLTFLQRLLYTDFVPSLVRRIQVQAKVAAVSTMLKARAQTSMGQGHLSAVDGLRVRRNGSWGETKLSSLNRYLGPALRATEGKWDRVYVDLFAGPAGIGPGLAASSQGLLCARSAPTRQATPAYTSRGPSWQPAPSGRQSACPPGGQSDGCWGQSDPA
jgi:hypothetical protein